MTNLEALEARINQGNRDSMAFYLASALSDGVSEEELQRRYKIVRHADHGNDSMVLRNLAIVAAAFGNYPIAEAFAEDFMRHMFFADAFHSALALRRYGSEKETEKARAIFAQLAEKGHIRSQVEQKAETARVSGFAYNLWFQVYRLSKIIQATVLVVRNPNDPRILV